jgi:hypothetical protein
VTALWDIDPQLYDPLPDIFSERLRHAEAEYIVTPATYRDAEGAMLKTLVRSTSLAESRTEICGPENSFAPIDSKPASAPVLRPSELGFAFVSGRLTCTFGVPGTIEFSEAAFNRPQLLKGWGRFDPQGTWSTGKRASLRIRFKEPMSGRVLLRFFGYGYALAEHPEQTAIVAVKGTKVGRWTVHFPDVRFDQTLAVDLGSQATRTLTLDFALPDAVSPQSVAGSSDARLLGIHLEKILLSRP